jgi:hypothetical protein
VRADKFEVINTYGAIQIVARLALNIPLDEAQAVVNEMEHTDAVMPLIDPSGWLRIRATAPQHQRLARAFLAFRQELAALVKEGAGSPLRDEP